MLHNILFHANLAEGRSAFLCLQPFYSLLNDFQNLFWYRKQKGFYVIFLIEGFILC